MPTYAHLTPEVLRWARESVGLSTNEAARSLGIWAYQIEAAEQGNDLLTLPQAEELAELYERPLAALFMPEPPAEDSPEAQFRRLPGAPELPWPPAMHKLARRIRDRQDSAAELLDLLDEIIAWPRTVERLRGVPPTDLATRARLVLGISIPQQRAWQDTTGYAPLRAWIDAIEALGILVMQNGDMSTDVMRGFASVHDEVPAIVVNTKDDPRARAFTAVHELGHLLWPASGAPGVGTEAWCNEFAGDVLMPQDAFVAAFEESRPMEPWTRANKLALAFGVTPLAAAVRIARLGLAGSAADELVAAIRNRPAPERDPGGNFYLNKVAWLGPSFIRLVLEAADEQAVTLSNAAGLLGAKVTQFDKLRQRVEERRSGAG